MENARLQQLLHIVDTALLQKPEERHRYLTRLCLNNEGLLHEAQALLESIDRSEPFWQKWQTRNDRAMQTLFQELGEVPLEPERIGPWRLIKLLGQGGMGNVFLGQRADGQYQQQVAIKVLRQGLQTGRSLHGFEQERQILANLDHPNIARLYDGGVLTDGRPWLAMQYVNGLPLFPRVKEHNSSLSERLDLFQQVCDGVRYAHTNLIVHRDLKPDNILVTENGTVKILDFGIAKLLNDVPHQRAHLRTQTGLRLFSLDYAAPEQITGEPVTTATDVYALGLLFYELLTGTYPFDVEGKNQPQVEQVLRYNDPARPSTVTSRWKSELRGDLDAIVLKALRKEPDRRYENAGQMADDITRYRSNLPVYARGDAFRYRAGKFYKRNRGKLVAALAVLITIVSLVTYYTIRVTNERNEAQKQARRAGQVSDFLTGLFEASDPGHALGENVTALELLERGSANIRENLKNDPETRASLLEVLGTVYQHMGKYEKAQSLFGESLSLKREMLDPLNPDIARNLNEMASALLYQGQQDKAKEYLAEALDIHRQLNHADYPEYASTLNNLAFIYLQKNELDSAETMFRRAIVIRKKHIDHDSLKLATNLDGLAVTLERKGEDKEAEKFYRKALDIREKNLAANHPDMARSLNNLAGFLVRQGDMGNAEPLYRQALSIWRKVLGDEHLDVAKAMNNLASVLEKQGRLDDAEPLYQESLSIKRKTLGDEHISVAISMNNLGLLLRKNGEFEASEPLLKESLRIRRKVHNNQPHPQIARGLQSLASLYEDMARYPEAIALYRQELTMRDRVQPIDRQKIARAKLGLGSCLVHLRHFEEAEPLLRECYAEFQILKDEESSGLARQRLSELYTAWGRPERAAWYQAQLGK